MIIGGPGGVRTLDLMTARLAWDGYLVDFAARLATQRHAKARSERSSCTGFVLVRPEKGRPQYVRWLGRGRERVPCYASAVLLSIAFTKFSDSISVGQGIGDRQVEK
jgi:hypothetical protein